MACRIPFLFLLLFTSISLAVVPAVLIYIVVFVALNKSITILTATSAASLTNLSTSYQSVLISQVSAALVSRLEEGVHQVDTMMTILRSSNVPNLYLSNTNPEVLNDLWEMSVPLFGATLSSPFVSSMVVRTIEPSKQIPTFPLGNRTFLFGHYAAWTDVVRNTVRERTLYTSTFQQVPNGSFGIYHVYYPNQLTGANPKPLLSVAAPNFVGPVRDRAYWASDLNFTVAQPQLFYYPISIPALNGTWVDIILAWDALTFTRVLQDAVANAPLERLFIFFRQPHGHLLGASHGKWHSHSDVDVMTTNQLLYAGKPLNPTPYTCLQSTDAIISEACQVLYTNAQKDWQAVAEGTLQMNINGTLYWATVSHNERGVNCTVVSLKPHAAVLGAVESSMWGAQQMVDEQLVWVYAILALATTMSVTVPVLFWCLLRWRLRQNGNQLQDMVNNMHWMGVL